MILSKTKTKKYKFLDAEINVTYAVPTAVDTEEIITTKVTDTALVSKFVNLVKSHDIDELLEGVDGKALITLPGTYSLCHQIAVDIVSDMMVSTEEKN